MITSNRPYQFLKSCVNWLILCTIMGIVGGLMGAVFHYALQFVTHIRLENTWLVWLLPVGGLLTVGLYRLLKLHGNKGTNEIIEATLEGKPVDPRVMPAIFLASTITHLFGGSAGREGAALQLGGSTASWLAKKFDLRDENRTLLIMAGMSSVFAGLFRTPLTACLFTMEFGSVGTILSPALLPCYLTSFIASEVSAVLGVHAEGILIETGFSVTLLNCWQYLLLSVLVSVLGITMCTVFHKAEHLAQHTVKNPWIRIALGGGLIAVMTILAGDQRFNGAGMDMALAAVSGEADWYSFILKMLFTAVTLASGFKGGEIVPTFCIGATFGCVVGGLLGLDAGFAGALGLVGLFCCATNSPLASIILSVEMFGSRNLYIFALVSVVCFVLSGEGGLYASQIIRFPKAHKLGK